MKRLIAFVATALMVISLQGPQAAQAAPGSADRSPHTAVPITPSLTPWQTCRDATLQAYGIECGQLTVPLDYADPTRGSIQLAVTRRAHQPSAGGYLGIIVGNPGGPGGSGTWIPALADYVPNGVGQRFDWVGFDPRGVGASTPALHCDANYFGTNRPNYVPRTIRLMRFWLTKTRGYSHECGRAAARKLLPYMTTRDTVRDLDALRQALGSAKLNYYGFSYGTYIGQVYATRYPSKVGKFVLDGVVDPTKVWYRANLDQDRAFDRNLNIYFRWLAENASTFHLGTSWKRVRADYYRQLRKLDRKPAANGRLGPDELNDAMVDVGYGVYDWAGVGKAYARLVHSGHGGELFSMYASSNMGYDNDNGFAVYNAVQCTDVAWPRWPRQRRDSWSMHRRAPFLTWNNTWYNAPCRNWPVAAQHRTKVTGKSLTSKILLVSETLDAATPYSGAMKTRDLFPSASLIAGKNGTTHASSLSGVGCVDFAVAFYLRTGIPPTRQGIRGADRVCPALPPPSLGGGMRTDGLLGLPPSLRQRLVQAQTPGR